MTQNQMKQALTENLFQKNTGLLYDNPETLSPAEFHEALGAAKVLAQILDISTTNHTCSNEMAVRDLEKLARARRAQCIITT